MTVLCSPAMQAGENQGTHRDTAFSLDLAVHSMHLQGIPYSLMRWNKRKTNSSSSGRSQGIYLPYTDEGGTIPPVHCRKRKVQVNTWHRQKSRTQEGDHMIIHPTYDFHNCHKIYLEYFKNLTCNRKKKSKPSGNIGGQGYKPTCFHK